MHSVRRKALVARDEGQAASDDLLARLGALDGTRQMRRRLVDADRIATGLLVAKR